MGRKQPNPPPDIACRPKTPPPPTDGFAEFTLHICNDSIKVLIPNRCKKGEVKALIEAAINN